MANAVHTREQGFRVHHLANLGGLVALAGLDLEPPDFLLGAFLQVAIEAAQLNQQQRAEIAAIGQKKLDERATSKRAWKSWRKARELHGLMLTTEQMGRLISALGSKPPQDTGALMPALMQALEARS